jgi:hypothetical protein
VATLICTYFDYNQSSYGDIPSTQECLLGLPKFKVGIKLFSVIFLNVSMRIPEAAQSCFELHYRHTRSKTVTVLLLTQVTENKKNTCAVRSLHEAHFVEVVRNYRMDSD